MIFATLVSDVTAVLTVLALGFVVTAWLATKAVGGLARHMRNDYRRQGGAKSLLKQGVARASGRLLRRWLLGR
jgi:hypothetical protein